MKVDLTLMTRVVTKLEKDGGSTQTGVPGSIALINSHGIYTAYTQGNGRHVGIERRLNPAAGTGATNPPIEKFQFFYHGDHLGSSSFITDDAGAVYQHLEYFPYGETWVEEGGSGQMPMYRFTGKELDPETGLYYYGARYYDPVLSKWISADPALGKYLPTLDSEKNKNLPGQGGAFKPINLALYSYASNDPLLYTDPTGLFSLKETVDWVENKAVDIVGKTPSSISRPIIAASTYLPGLPVYSEMTKRGLAGPRGGESSDTYTGNPIVNEEIKGTKLFKEILNSDKQSGKRTFTFSESGLDLSESIHGFQYAKDKDAVTIKDTYAFPKGERGFLGELVTAFGRSAQLTEYPVEIRIPIVRPDNLVSAPTGGSGM